MTPAHLRRIPAARALPSTCHQLAPPTSLVPPENQYTYLGNLPFQVSPDRFQVSTYPYARTRRWRVIRRASAAACPRTAERRFNILHLPAHLPSWPVARFLTQFEHGAQASGTVTSHITTDQVHRPQIKFRMNLQFTQAEGRATSRLTRCTYGQANSHVATARSTSSNSYAAPHEYIDAAQETRRRRHACSMEHRPTCYSKRLGGQRF